jgi:hypothetical protein
MNHRVTRLMVRDESQSKSVKEEKQIQKDRDRD